MSNEASYTIFSVLYFALTVTVYVSAGQFLIAVVPSGIVTLFVVLPVPVSLPWFVITIFQSFISVVQSDFVPLPSVRAAFTVIVSPRLYSGVSPALSSVNVISFSISGIIFPSELERIKQALDIIDKSFKKNLINDNIRCNNEYGLSKRGALYHLLGGWYGDFCFFLHYCKKNNLAVDNELINNVIPVSSLGAVSLSLKYFIESKGSGYKPSKMSVSLPVSEFVSETEVF